MNELIKAIPPVIVISLIIKGIYLLGDDKKYTQFKKGNKRLKKSLKTIIDNPAVNEFVFKINTTIGVLNLIIAAIYFITNYQKNIYLTTILTLVLISASVNFVSKSYHLKRTTARKSN